MNLLLPLHNPFMNQMRTRLQEKNAVPVRIICVSSENLLNRKRRFLKKTMPLLKKTNSSGSSKNSLLKFNLLINIVASESHHMKSDGILFGYDINPSCIRRVFRIIYHYFTQILFRYECNIYCCHSYSLMMVRYKLMSLPVMAYPSFMNCSRYRRSLFTYASCLRSALRIFFDVCFLLLACIFRFK